MCVVLSRNAPMIFGKNKASLFYTPDDDYNEDEYELGTVTLDASVWTKRSGITDFNQAWALTHLFESTQVVVMSKDKTPIKAAKRLESEIIRLENISEEKGQRKLTLCFAGKTIEGDQLILVQADIGSSKIKGIMCRVAVRAEIEELCQSIINSFEF